MERTVLLWQVGTNDFLCPALDVADAQLLLHLLLAEVEGRSRRHRSALDGRDYLEADATGDRKHHVLARAASQCLRLEFDRHIGGSIATSAVETLRLHSRRPAPR